MIVLLGLQLDRTKMSKACISQRLKEISKLEFHDTGHSGVGFTTLHNHLPDDNLQTELLLETLENERNLMHWMREERINACIYISITSAHRNRYEYTVAFPLRFIKRLNLHDISVEIIVFDSIMEGKSKSLRQNP